MLYLVTGTPGAGKTLLTIKDISTRFPDRKVFYHNIELTDEGLNKLVNWHAIDREQVIKWHELEAGSIVLIDEAHEIFPKRGFDKAEPKYIEGLARHRHYGLDFYFITQHPMDLDLFIRRRIEGHVHYKRQFGFERCTRFSWEEYADVNDYHSYKKATSKRISYPKDIYNLYKSSTLHTVQKRIPKQFYIIPFVILLIIAMLYLLYYKMFASHRSDDKPSSDLVSASGSSANQKPLAANSQSTVAAGVVTPFDKSKLIYALPPYLHNVKEVYLTGVFNVPATRNFKAFSRVNYRIVKMDDSYVNVTSDLLLKLGAHIRPIDSCTHQIFLGALEYPLWTSCPPVLAEGGSKSGGGKNNKPDYYHENSPVPEIISNNAITSSMANPFTTK